jgi:hypothetical protein
MDFKVVSAGWVFFNAYYSPVALGAMTRALVVGGSLQ